MYIATKTKWPPLASPVVKVMFRSDVLWLWVINHLWYDVVCFTSLEAELENVQFEKLDFGETSVLDLFYNADVVIVDMSIPVQQSALFYHIGVRQSMEMKFNIVLHYDVDPEQSLALRVSSSLPPRSHPLGSITSPTSQLVIIPFFNSVFHSPNPQKGPNFLFICEFWVMCPNLVP